MNTTKTAFQNADDGVAKSATSAGVAWIQTATEHLKTLLENNPSFFCDDIWNTGLVRGNQPKALGQVVRKAVKDGGHST